MTKQKENARKMDWIWVLGDLSTTRKKIIKDYMECYNKINVTTNASIQSTECNDNILDERKY